MLFFIVIFQAYFAKIVNVEDLKKTNFENRNQVPPFNPNTIFHEKGALVNNFFFIIKQGVFSICITCKEGVETKRKTSYFEDEKKHEEEYENGVLVSYKTFLNGKLIREDWFHENEIATFRNHNNACPANCICNKTSA